MNEWMNEWMNDVAEKQSKLGDNASTYIKT